MNDYERNQKLQQARQFAEQGRIDEALQWFLMAGAAEEAIDLLSMQGRFMEAAHLLLSQLGIPPRDPGTCTADEKQLVAKAASLLCRDDEWAYATELYLQMGAPQQARKLQDWAINQFTHISHREPRYRKACSQMIRLSIMLGNVPEVVSFILKGFVQSGPQNEQEAEEFYQFTLYFLQMQQPNQALPLLQRLRGYDPNYRDIAHIMTQLGRY